MSWAAPALAQQAVVPAPIVVAPVVAPTPKSVAPAPTPQLADTHVESTELGFDKGIGPAVGRTVSYQNKLYEVTDVSAAGGRPTFSGGSRFAIAPAGCGLMVGLKALDQENLAALPPSPLSAVN